MEADLLRKKLRILVFAILGVTLPSSRAQGPARLSTGQWTNLPSSPMRFEAGPQGKGYVLGNYSTGRVIRYRLGCVEEKRGKVSVLSHGSFQHAGLGPIDLKGDPENRFNYKIQTLVSGITHGFDLEKCQDNAKNAVVEVEFEDGHRGKPNGKLELFLDTAI
jgi:hypothetical protein